VKYLVFSFLLIASTSKASVWQVNQQWTPTKETEFSLFIENEFSADIFSNPNSKFYGVPTDCADAVYIARVIFAAREGLPVRFSDITKGGAYFSQEISRWDSQASDKRLRSFLHYVSEMVSTLTLEKDTYPVMISKEWLRPGVIFLSPILSNSEQAATGFHGGHSEYLKSITDTGFLEFIASTSPRLVRTLSLSRNPYLAPLVTRGGLRLWKNPQDFGRPVSSFPGYGLNQFELGNWAPLKLITRRQIFQWHEEIRRVLRTRIPSFEERVDIVVENVCNLLRVRAELVRQGWQEVVGQGGRCLSAEKTDQYSTDTRDQRIRGAYLQLNDLYDWLARNPEENPGDPINGNINDAQKKLSECTIEYWPGRTMTAWDVFSIVRAHRLESSAYYAPAVRWGFRAPQGKDCK
jgi:hypothetical protein